MLAEAEAHSLAIASAIYEQRQPVLLRQKERKIVQVSVGERSVVATMSQSADDAVQGSCPPSPVFPKFSNIPETLSPTFQKHFPTYVGGLFVSTPHNFVSTPAYANAAEKLYHFEPKKDDVWIMTFPKSGEQHVPM